MSKENPFLIGQSAKEIDGLTFTVTQFPGGRAARIWARLVKLIGEPLGALVQGFAASGSASLNAIPDISGTVKKLVDNLDAPTFEGLVKELLASTAVQGVGPDGNQRAGNLSENNLFDAVFAGRMALMFKVIAFVLQENYGDFFGMFAALQPAASATKTTGTGNATA